MGKRIEDEIVLRKELDALGIRYGDTYNDFYFLVEFRDNKGSVVIAKDIFYTPIAAVRSLGTVIKQTNLPSDDIDVVLTYAIPINNHTVVPQYLEFILDPYLYYKKPESSHAKEN